MDSSFPGACGMHLSDHDLRQLDEAYLAKLTPEQARALLSKALEDLKAARERLGQNPSNSSRPPSTRAPWEQAEAEERDREDAASAQGEVKPQTEPEPEPTEEKPEKTPQDKGAGKPAGRPGRRKGALSSPMHRTAVPFAAVSWMSLTKGGHTTPAMSWSWCPPLTGALAWCCGKPSTSISSLFAPVGIGAGRCPDVATTKGRGQ